MVVHNNYIHCYPEAVEKVSGLTDPNLLPGQDSYHSTRQVPEVYHNFQVVCTHNEAAVAELELVLVGPNYQKGDMMAAAYSYWLQMYLTNVSAESEIEVLS